MTKEDARIEVIKLWHVWQGNHPTVASPPDEADAAEFFDYIVSEEPYLLGFASRPHRWPAVHEWLRQARLVSD